MPRRIRRPADKEDLFEALTKGDQALFSTYKDVMMMSACIGFDKGVRKPFTKTLEQVAWNIFKDTDAAVIDAMSLAETDDMSILLDDEDTFDKKLTIFEEYANAGLDVIRSEIVNAPGRALENTINHIFSRNGFQHEQEGSSSIFADLVKSLRIDNQ